MCYGAGHVDEGTDGGGALPWPYHHVMDDSHRRFGVINDGFDVPDLLGVVNLPDLRDVVPRLGYRRADSHEGESVPLPAGDLLTPRDYPAVMPTLRPGAEVDLVEDYSLQGPQTSADLWNPEPSAERLDVRPQSKRVCCPIGAGSA